MQLAEGGRQKRKEIIIPLGVDKIPRNSKWRFFFWGGGAFLMHLTVKEQNKIMVKIFISHTLKTF